PPRSSNAFRTLLLLSAISSSSPSLRPKTPEQEAKQIMPKRLLLVSTCGTSLLTNGASTEDRVWLTKIANDVEVDAARLTPLINAGRERLKAADEPTRRKVSAELNGVGAVIDRYQPKQVFHLLVH